MHLGIRTYYVITWLMQNMLQNKHRNVSKFLPVFNSYNLYKRVVRYKCFFFKTERFLNGQYICKSFLRLKCFQNFPSVFQGQVAASRALITAGAGLAAEKVSWCKRLMYIHLLAAHYRLYIPKKAREA